MRPLSDTAAAVAGWRHEARPVHRCNSHRVCKRVGTRRDQGAGRHGGILYFPRDLAREIDPCAGARVDTSVHRRLATRVYRTPVHAVCVRPHPGSRAGPDAAHPRDKLASPAVNIIGSSH
jgi:hypothetical protein